jgi:hypothetical protein
MADTWFRFYNDAVVDPKVQRLSGDMFKAWVNILCLASKFDGALPKDDIQYSLRLTEDEARELVAFFIERNLLDDLGDVVAPHNWNGRQYKSDTSTERVKRHRETKRNVSETVAETPPEQSRAETEQILDSADEVHGELLKIARTDVIDPVLFGSHYGIQGMLRRGFSRETILAGAANAMRGKARPPNWNYFAKCIESEKEIAREKPENLVETARRLSGEVVGFGPRPSLMGGLADSNPVRLLPKGGGE